VYVVVADITISGKLNHYSCKSIIIRLLKDGKTHLRIKVSEKVQNTKYMTMYDKIKSVRISKYDTVIVPITALSNDGCW